MRASGLNVNDALIVPGELMILNLTMFACRKVILPYMIPNWNFRNEIFPRIDRLCISIRKALIVRQVHSSM